MPDPSKLALKAILFDLDATLADSRPIYETAFQRTFSQILGIELDAHQRRQFMGLPTIDYLMQYAEGEQLKQLAASLAEHVKRLMPTVKLFAGFEVLLPELRRAGLLLGVVTSQTRAECSLTRGVLQIDQWIDVWVTSEDTERVKPDPQPVLAALYTLDVAAKQALMVGDSIYDLKAGRAAGTRVAVAGWGAANLSELLAFAPDVVFDHPQQMLSILYDYDSAGDPR